MDAARADALAARAHLLEAAGWQFRRGDAFRVMPPPPAALWLGDDMGATTAASDGAACEAPPLAGAGWTLHPVGAPGLVNARWLDATHPAQRAQLLAGLPPSGDDAAAPFAWAHRALCRQGLRLRIEAAAEAGAPPVLLQLRHLPRAAVEAPLLALELEAGARCVLIETHVRDDAAACVRAPTDQAADRQAARGCTKDVVQNLQVHLQLGAGARLQHWRLAEPGAGDRIAHHVHARLADGAFYGQALLATGSAYHLQRTLVALDGVGARSHVGNVLVADGEHGRQLDRQVRVVHAARRGTSVVDVLALARARALVAADVHAHVRPGAEEADVRQHLAGIPTAGAPRLVLRPQLEIEHDAVQAAHGATWGRLPEEALFLARQRGLDEATALALILQGMASAVLARGFDDDTLAETVGARAALGAALAGHLRGAAAGEHHG